MRAWIGLASIALVAGMVTAPFASGRAAGDAKEDGNTLVYADFENSTDGRPISSRGGKLNLWGYQESPTRFSVFKGHPEDNGTPMLVRTSKENTNHAAAFEYELVIPNQWAGVTMEVQGRPPDANGLLPGDDVTRFKSLMVQAYVTGISYMRVEIMSNGQGINLHSGYPMTSFKVRDGFNTYKMPLTAFSQPAWVSDTRIDPKEVLKRLTSITFSVFCDDCRPYKGMVIIDNIVFEK